MQNSQIVAVLKSFSKKETREFRKWLLSPFHNQRKDVLDLFDYFQKNDHLTKEHLLSKTKIYPKIFGKEPFNDAKIRQTMHFLQKQLDDYLGYKEFKSNEVGNKIFLLRAYRKKKLEKPVKKTISAITELQKNYPYKDFDYLWNQYRFQQEVFYGYHADQGRKRSVQLNLQEVVDALDQAYFANKIKQSCFMLQHQRVSRTEYNKGIINEILTHVNAEKLLNVPAIAVYYYLYKTYPETESEKYFYQLRDALNKHLKFFPEQDARDILQMAIYYCIERMNRGKELFVRESFELYKYGVESTLLLSNNRIARWDFNNIVRLGSLTREFDWVHDFIEKYQDYLEAADRENIVHFGRAKLFYAEGNYAASMRELALVKEDDILLNLSSKHTLLKIYFETDEFEPLEFLLDSMGRYIRRKDVPSNYKMVYESIIRLTKKMSRTNPYNKEQIKSLQQEIAAAPALPPSERAWFFKQVENL